MQWPEMDGCWSSNFSSPFLLLLLLLVVVYLGGVSGSSILLVLLLVGELLGRRIRSWSPFLCPSTLPPVKEMSHGGFHGLYHAFCLSIRGGVVSGGIQ